MSPLKVLMMPPRSSCRHADSHLPALAGEAHATLSDLKGELLEQGVHIITSSLVAKSVCLLMYSAGLGDSIGNRPQCDSLARPARFINGLLSKMSAAISSSQTKQRAHSLARV